VVAAGTSASSTITDLAAEVGFAAMKPKRRANAIRVVESASQSTFNSAPRKGGRFAALMLGEALATYAAACMIPPNAKTTADAAAGANAALLAEMCQVPYVSVRRSDLVFRGWKVRHGGLPDKDASVTLTAPDLEPNIHQKGVDMRLGLDIAALTLKSHVGAFVLAAGDSDFVPAMKFARREGAQLVLVTLGHSVRADMPEHSDLMLDIPAGGASAVPSFMRRDGAGLDARVNQSALPVD
jgi:hypothetical protein